MNLLGGTSILLFFNFIRHTSQLIISHKFQSIHLIFYLSLMFIQYALYNMHPILSILLFDFIIIILIFLSLLMALVKSHDIILNQTMIL
jgi:hypothetical protein